MSANGNIIGFPSIDKPWLKYYKKGTDEADLPKCTIYDYIWECNKSNLSDVALRYFGVKITFKELFDNIEKVTKAFSVIGIKKGDIVIMATVTIPETIYAIYAINRLGAIPNMVDPRTSIEGIKEYIRESKSTCILTLDVAYPKIEKAIVGTNVDRVIISSPSDSLSITKKPLFKVINKVKGKSFQYSGKCIIWRKFITNGVNANYNPVCFQENSCCVIEHTGGTTGMPKGVMLSNENLNASAFQIQNSLLNLQRRDIFLNIMPPFIAYGMVLGIHVALVEGWHSVLIPNFNPTDFDRLILKYRPSGIMGVPTHFESLMTSKRIENKDLSFIKVILVGGDKAKIEFETKVNKFFQRHGAEIHLSKGYSMTEASATATFSFEEINKLGSSGIPFAQTVIAAFEEGTDIELPYDKAGEICISTPTMMLGYYKIEEASTILKRHNDGRMWIHSGDLGYVDKDGCVYIDGRIKRMIIRYDGFKVFPSFIENIISKNKAIKSCCVIGVRDKEHSQGELPVAFCVLNPEYINKKSEIIVELTKICRRELPEYAQPIVFHFKDVLPLTSIGKIDYKALEMEENGL